MNTICQQIIRTFALAVVPPHIIDIPLLKRIAAVCADDDRSDVARRGGSAGPEPAA
jgi:hypothetical protein